jgi:hypothetical protein
MTRRRRLPPRPPDPPAGMMWWHGELMTIAAVERMAKVIIGRHDDPSEFVQFPQHLGGNGHTAPTGDPFQ